MDSGRRRNLFAARWAGGECCRPEAGRQLPTGVKESGASTPHTFSSWPDGLAERFAARGALARTMAVVNHGIPQNQVLRDGAGISALARFDRDVLAIPGLIHIVLLEGINDIGAGGL